MLKYFKKQKSRHNECDDNNDIRIGEDSAKRNSLRSTSSFCDEVFLEEEEGESSGGGLSLSSIGVGIAGNNDSDLFKYHSRLSMSLPSIVNDPNCLSYFVQYLETRNALALIKFYLDTENFKTAALLQLENESQDTIEDKSLTNESKEPSSITEQSEEVIEHNDHKKNVPELKTICDLSMRKPLTDDEKSQIYAETNKQITKCNSNHKSGTGSELSLCSESAVFNMEPDLGSENAGTISAASTKDAITIYQKYLIANAKHFVYLPVAILSQISLLLCKRSDEELADTLPISPSCFDDAQRYSLEQLEREFLNDFLQSTFYCKYCIELIESDLTNSVDILNICDILYSEVTLFFFMEFLEQHGERVCLEFWTAAINFRKSCINTAEELRDESEIQADAMIIYDKFFSLQSDCRLWLSDKLRSRVEERICAAGEVAHCFDLPLQVVAKYLERKYLADFLKTQLFENYLNDLKIKMQEELLKSSNNDASDTVDFATSHTRRHSQKHANKSTRHRKTMSDCSNDHARELLKHISQQNTLLAMDTTHLKNLHTTGTNLNIDSRQLTNPHLLWHRSTAQEGGLKFGHISALGRYERDFEGVDTLNGAGKHNWSLSMSGSKIKNAMRKLVNLPEEKVQEEIAWQVAEMIVKDVTNITLSGVKAHTTS